MKEYAIEFTYSEMSKIRELASKELAVVCVARGENMVQFYLAFSDTHKRRVMDITPCTEHYILASIIRRCDEMEDKIKEDLKKTKRGKEDAT